ncbi:DUF2591 family protein [Enterobacter kobei]|uniref:phage protein NinX family protein n=1 Tax=Enterobacter kobei TaxID=208224 RepID=UPI0018C21DCC|nr:phage protein NinX family protein [Enterobacter kobei]MBG0644835.1 DUF2591 family protein [Enterobacter kobei]
MDYSQLSDFEINKRVAQLHGGFALTLAVHDEPPSGKSFDPGRFDPCHNPADAWPIIVGSKINIRFGAEGMACEAQFMQYGHESVECYHANPLRAAMIVFLMMQDANNA